MHMAIDAPRAMQEKIDDVLSIDGPWFSDQYAEKYSEEIARLSDRMTHYKYSLVGGLLVPLPGIEDRVIDSTENYDICGRHALETIMLDENGNVIDGDERLESKIVQSITEGAERLSVPELIYNLMPNFIKDYLGVNKESSPLFGLQALVFTLGTLLHICYQVGEAMDGIKSWVSDVRYKYFKPQVSGDFEMSYGQTKSVLTEIKDKISKAKREISIAKDTLNSIRSSWSGGAFLRSVIRANIRSLENDIQKLERLATIMEHAMERYKRADDDVANTFNG